MVTGVAGGLGEYFGVDPVLFRVLFAVLSFFGGVGLLLYLLCWLLIPEPDATSSALDKGIDQLRLRRVPPWLVIVGGALALWLGWFSWWAPGPTFPALMLVAVILIVLVSRLGRRARFGERGHAAYPWEQQAPAGQAPAAAATAAATAESAAGDPTTLWPMEGEPVQPAPTEPLVAPLSDFRRNMQAWVSEASEARKQRLARRRPIKIGVATALGLGWATLAVFNSFNRVPLPAYIWVGLAVLGTGFLVSLVTRRLVLSLLAPMALLAAVALFFGGTSASLKDGSGRVGWTPTSVAQLTDHRQFAGQTTLDLTQLAALPAAESVTITQAAGEVRLLLPANLNATVVADVHTGDIQVGSSRDTGKYVGGWNVHLEVPPVTATTGKPLTIHVDLTVGHVQIDRVG
jgi:phage shock protein PspC (stress-responsive transcriptional regulator)